MPNTAVEASNGADSSRSPRLAYPEEKALQGSLSAIEHFLAGDDDPEILDDLRQRITRWMLDDNGPELHRALGLGTRRAARLSQRDGLLRQAAGLIPGSVWDRSRAILAASRLVEIRRARRWSRHGVPDDAGPIERLVFEAGRLEAIPTSLVRVRDIILSE